MHGVDIASLLLTILGLLLTVTALGVAIAIYQRQNVEQESFRRHVDQRLDGLMARRIDEETIEEAPSDPADASEAPIHVTRTIGDVSVINPTDIPIGVIGDLGAAITQGQLGNHGGWLLGEVRAGYRRTGKGNHPWYLLLDDRDQTNNTWVARIARGGQAKSAPTVTIEEAGKFFGEEG